jgi:hypothetical protein
VSNLNVEKLKPSFDPPPTMMIEFSKATAAELDKHIGRRVDIVYHVPSV